jgi:hypothetical protein
VPTDPPQVDRIEAIDLGTVDYRELSGLDLSAGSVTLALQTVRDGYLTVYAPDTAPDVDLTLYELNTDGRLVERMSGAGRIDLHDAVAGTPYYIAIEGSEIDTDLRVANLVQQTESTVEVFGTGQSDEFVLDLSQHVDIEIKGATYQFTHAEVTTIHFDGRDGQDNAEVLGSPANGTARFSPTSVTWNDVVDATISNSERIVIAGGGGSDVAHMFDSTDNDAFTGTPAYGRFEGPGHFNEAQHFDQVYAHASVGADTAKLYDSSGNDNLTASPTAVTLTGAQFFIQAEGFESSYVVASNGGADRAEIRDSAGDDFYVGTPTDSRFVAPESFIRARLFDSITVRSSTGNDVAHLFGSPGDDTYTGQPTVATLRGDNFLHRAEMFPEVHTVGKGGRGDVAYLFDSDGYDVFTGTHVYGRMAGTTRDGHKFFHRAARYDQVFAESSGGNDKACFRDSPWDDQFEGAPQQGRMFLPGRYDNRASGFSRVFADAKKGGNDVARLLDSAADDTFLGRPNEGSLYGTDFLIRVRYFDEIFADAAGGGTDTAILDDSPQPDVLRADGDRARLTDAAMTRLLQITAFDQVTARSSISGDDDIVEVAAGPEFALYLDGDWES